MECVASAAGYSAHRSVNRRMYPPGKTVLSVVKYVVKADTPKIKPKKKF